MKNLNTLSAATAAAGIRSKKFTSEELISDCLNRLNSREDDIQAWSYINAEHALEQAKKADKYRNEGGSLGPLHGVPIGIKDVIDTEDMPTENGSPIYEGRRPQKDALCIAALRRAGAIIFGKTVTTEFANINPSKTRNPHNIQHSPGGSSAGSGASVADFHVPVALGTQTGGSVIRPASFNGVFGLKPTLGLIPRSGMLLQSHTLDTIGIYGRTLEDLALVLDSISIPDPNDAHSYRGSIGSVQAEHSKTSKHQPKFAFLETPAWNEGNLASKKAILKTTEILGQNCKKETLPDPFNKIIDLHATVFSSENAYYYGQYLISHPNLLSKKLRHRLESTRNALASDYLTALEARNVIYNSVETLLGNYDAIICLSAPGPAPHGFETTGSAVFNGLWTYLGVPCISLPLLTVEGLPQGIQLVGKRGEEGKLFRSALKLEQALDGKLDQNFK
ncbi:MAG: amidase [Alphaproteobacteria bacterium]|mgnify:FL=1|nr:amidase [Alphaproteobacteria bacterium]